MVRQNMSAFLQFIRTFVKNGRGVESELSSARATPMDVHAVGKGKGKECFVCGRPGHEAQDCRARVKERWRARLTRTVPPSFEGECRHYARKRHKSANCWKRLADAKDKKDHAVDVSAVDCDGGGSGRQR